MEVGYARISTWDQENSLECQEKARPDAGCSKVFHDGLSGTGTDSPGQANALCYLRDGEDVLVIPRLATGSDAPFQARCGQSNSSPSARSSCRLRTYSSRCCGA